ncbi:MAG TPA: hypothetical protein VKR53_21675 [Puia sp.]|nr:hypothetical protein [Puia sp.]
MKRFIVLLLVLSMGKLQAQFAENSATLKAGVGYTHDFPGLNGYTGLVEYISPAVSSLQGAMGIKHADITGFPRTSSVQEYTKATTLDLNLYWLPLQSENELFRVGLGYSFSFYHINRAYPLVVSDNGTKTIAFSSQQTVGKTRGINLIADYEYKIPATIISVGLRAALYKAYTRTYFFGPMLGFQL